MPQNTATEMRPSNSSSAPRALASPLTANSQLATPKTQPTMKAFIVTSRESSRSIDRPKAMAIDQNTAMNDEKPSARKTAIAPSERKW